MYPRSESSEEARKMKLTKDDIQLEKILVNPSNHPTNIYRLELGINQIWDKEQAKQLKQQILDDYEKARLCDELCKILMNHCGEDGDNEGAVETLNRISKKARKYEISQKKIDQIYKNSIELQPILIRNQILREICERLNITEETDVSEIVKFLKESKK